VLVSLLVLIANSCSVEVNVSVMSTKFAK